MLKFAAITFCAALLAAAGCSASGTYVGRSAAPVQERSPFRTYTFDNGLRLIVKDNGHGPTSVQLWIADGSMADPAGKSGLSHLVEHAMLSGSRHLPPGKAEFYIEGMGGRLFGHTGRDFSYIGATVPGPGWERAEDILFDLAAYPSFQPDEFERQKKAVRLEIAERAGEPEVALADNFFAQAFQSHPYRFAVAGLPEDVARITVQDVSNYYSRLYVPDNMVVVVCGDVRPGAAKSVVEKTFGGLPRVKPIDLRIQKEPFQIYRRSKEREMPVGLVYMGMGWRVAGAAEEDIYPLDVLAAVIGNGTGSRLYRELKERRGVAQEVDTELIPLHEQGVLMVSAYLLSEDDVRPVMDEVLKQFNRLKDEQITGAELARASSQLLSSHIADGETAEGEAYSYGYYATVYGSIDPGAYREGISKVTPQDVQRVAQKYLGEGNYTISIIKPK